MENFRKKTTILKFESQHLFEKVIFRSQERWLPGYSAPNTNTAHLNRYLWVSDYVSRKNVLDLACGSGFGSFHLANRGKARQVIAGDSDEKAIEYCKAKHPELNNLTFKIMDALNFSLSERMDVIVCFETIEHLRDPRLLLQNCLECLDDAGVFFVSTPVSKLSIDTNPKNPYHLIEWDIKEFFNLLQSTFIIEDVYIQPYLINKFRPLSFNKKNNSKINGKNNEFDLNFIDYTIINSKAGLDGWQSLINQNLIGAYIILKCKKK